MNEEKPQESLLDGDISNETAEDLYEPTDDELLYPSRHYDWVHDKIPCDRPPIKVCDNGEICF